MKKHIISTLIAAATISSATVHAESLYDVYKLAIQTDPGLRAAAATYNAQKEQVTVTKGSLYPSISLNGSLGYAKNDTPTTNYDAKTNAVSLDLDYPIYSPALNYGVDAVELNYKSAGVSYDNKKENLSLTALTDYFNLLMAQSTLNTTLSQVKSTKSELDQVQKQYDVGLVSITDLQDAQAEYDAVKVTELTDRSNVAYAQKVLLQLTGRVITNIPELSKSYPIKLDPTMTVDSLIQQAIKNNKELSILDISVQSAENNIDIKKASGRTPTVSITGSLSRSNSQSNPNTSTPDGTYNKGAIGLAVNMPLYSGGSINASIRQAAAEAEASRESRDSALQSIELNIRSLFLELQTSVARIHAQQVLIKSRQSALEASKAGYEVGTRNLVELLTAQSNLFDARNAYQQYRYSFVLQKLQLLEATGDLTEDKIKGLDKWLVAAK
ncbi:TolC family outer membrane protein [Marinomonas sp. TI.3.20]|uniref:TolC family outer membrane protein n=1 Tax=Marinomonas sp. TI.3.20 TaxID=3121296 RepID=UPI00311EFB4A